MLPIVDLLGGKFYEGETDITAKRRQYKRPPIPQYLEGSN